MRLPQISSAGLLPKPKSVSAHLAGTASPLLTLSGAALPLLTLSGAASGALPHALVSRTRAAISHLPPLTVSAPISSLRPLMRALRRRYDLLIALAQWIDGRLHALPEIATPCPSRLHAGPGLGAT